MTIKSRIGKFILPYSPVNRKTIEHIRFEFGAVVTRMLNVCSPVRRMRLRKFRAMDGAKANIGSGGEGNPDWINIDVRRHHKDQSLAWDIRRELPFHDGQLSAVFAEHVVEHLNFREDVPVLFKSVFRSLKTGGVFRIIVPDGGRWVRAYAQNTDELWSDLGCEELPSDMPTHMCMLNHVFHQDGEHQFAWDFETLKWALHQAGFSDVSQTSFGVSTVEGLAIDLPHHQKYSLYVEAVK